MSHLLDELYLKWLVNQVCSVKNSSKTYMNLFDILYTKEFVWTVPNDDNRAEDGRYLRYIFLEEEGYDLTRNDQVWMDLGCSMLELFIGLSIRLEFQTDIPTSEWFWKLLKNLDLDKFSDQTSISREDVDDILDRVIWRTYDYDGHGGLFPMKHTTRDQRKIELWSQLHEYIDQDE